MQHKMNTTNWLIKIVVSHEIFGLIFFRYVDPLYEVISIVAYMFMFAAYTLKDIITNAQRTKKASSTWIYYFVSLPVQNEITEFILQNTCTIPLFSKDLFMSAYRFRTFSSIHISFAWVFSCSEHFPIVSDNSIFTRFI